MILLGAAFVHQRYLKMYFENMDPDILNYVNTKGNGEDITMNAVVADHLAKTLEPQCAGIHVQPQNLTALEKETSMCVHVYMCACGSWHAICWMIVVATCYVHVYLTVFYDYVICDLFVAKGVLSPSPSLFE